MNSLPSKRIGAVLASIALGLSACSAELDERGFIEDDNPPELTFSDEVGVDIPAAAFDFVASELFSGDPVDGAALFENAPTMLVFADPNCPICVADGPELAEAALEISDVNVVVVHSFAQSEAYLAYVERSDLSAESILHIVDTEGVLSLRFGLTATPATVMVAADGQVTVVSGALGVEGFKEAADLLVNA